MGKLDSIPRGQRKGSLGVPTARPAGPTPKPPTIVPERSSQQPDQKPDPTPKTSPRAAYAAGIRRLTVVLYPEQQARLGRLTKKLSATDSAAVRYLIDHCEE